MTPEAGPATPMVAASCLNGSSPAMSESLLPRRWTAPVFETPADRISIASTVTVAGFEKPDSPSATEMRVQGSSTIRSTITRMAVRSTGTSSTVNSAIASMMTPITTAMSGVRPHGRPAWRGVGRLGRRPDTPGRRGFRLVAVVVPRGPDRPTSWDRSLDPPLGP